MDAATVAPYPQNLLALEQANRVRLARAALKRKVAAGQLDAAEIVLACPWEVGGMSVGELLISQNRWGRTRCQRFLTPTGISETKALSSLTERQRTMLAALLTRKARAARSNGRQI